MSSHFPDKIPSRSNSSSIIAFPQISEPPRLHRTACVRCSRDSSCKKQSTTTPNPDGLELTSIQGDTTRKIFPKLVLALSASRSSSMNGPSQRDRSVLTLSIHTHTKCEVRGDELGDMSQVPHMYISQGALVIESRSPSPAQSHCHRLSPCLHPPCRADPQMAAVLTVPCLRVAMLYGLDGLTIGPAQHSHYV